ncbi:hypothetical protein P154DRAFT_596522 [Amniculicola lignicola CBS 123094]|uniref:Saccharopine dehydrogenase NADP binding domain-containing protein n=1 Tax=Amniculicola lignicola CBS 123094 TaxID=1392246 RepID=A0A6A5WKR4_9PLEO|nr:hypothetical protein P154DRAFT_596522 [Amniculicola lignicola CBS 123094]
MPPPDFDIIILGATGYTGTITAEHITSNFPSTFSWAIAGRSLSRLHKLSAHLQTIRSDRSPPTILQSSLDREDLHALVKRTKVVMNVVGPYNRYSEPVLEACASEGTHYVDFSTETPWIASMIPRYHEMAKKSGAIMIPAASNSSSPPDLLAWLIASKIRETTGRGTKEIVASGQLNMAGMGGGSAHTVLDVVQRYGIGWMWKPDPFCMVPRPQRPATPYRSPIGYQKHEDLGILTTNLPGISNMAIVNRSAALHPEIYGADFTYTELAPAPNAPVAIFTHMLLKLVILLLAFPPFRFLVRSLSYEPGSGPAWHEMGKKESVMIDAVGVSEDGKTKAKGRFAWKGAVAHVSAILVAEAAGVLVGWREKGEGERAGGGMVTPSKLGEELVERLRGAGCLFEVEVLGD